MGHDRDPVAVAHPGEDSIDGVERASPNLVEGLSCPTHAMGSRLDGRPELVAMLLMDLSVEHPLPLSEVDLGEVWVDLDVAGEGFRRLASSFQWGGDDGIESP